MRTTERIKKDGVCVIDVARVQAVVLDTYALCQLTY